MKLVYICSPLQGDIPGNMKKAAMFCKAAAAQGDIVPLAPHTIFTQYLDDTDPKQRERGLIMGRELIRRCDELWVCGRNISPGMKQEIAFANEQCIPVVLKPDMTLEHTELTLCGKLPGMDRQAASDELTQYFKVFPIKDSKVPYYVLQRNDCASFLYGPQTEEKFAVAVHNDFGKMFMGENGRIFGTYGNELETLLDDGIFNTIDIADKLFPYEPEAVYEYEEKHILLRLKQMITDTHARPCIFPGVALVPPIVSLPREVEDYLTPHEIRLTEKLIEYQECERQGECLQEEVSYEEVPEQEAEPEEEIEEDIEPEMCM